MSRKKILLVRADRLGDVILSTPAATALKKNLPAVHVTFLVRQYTAEILRCHPHVDEIIALDGAEIRNDISQLTHVLREKKFDAAIMLYPRPQLAWALWRCGIRQRIGTGYRWYSFLFTQRVFEHRKTAVRHEAEYNLSLLAPLGISTAAVEFHFALSESEQERIEKKLNALAVGSKPVILHPGSGGSSRDWPPEYFSGLADHICNQLGAQVIFTGAANETNLVGAILRQTTTKPLSLCGRLTLTELAVLCQRAAVFVGNSTGPLHLAVMVGAPVVAFYPPIRACRPERWGPYGRLSEVLMSQQAECTRCRQTAARVCDCMRAISVQTALQKIKDRFNIKK
jgi:heptosyltransferase-2